VSSAFTDPARQQHQERDGGERDTALRERTEMGEGGAAPILGISEIADVRDDVVDLFVSERGATERRHLAGSDADRFGRLEWCCRMYGRRLAMELCAAVAGRRMTRGALQSIQLAAGRH
jgi:hypothetical protein